MPDPSITDDWSQADAVASQAEQRLRDQLTSFVHGKSTAPSLGAVMEARMLRQVADDLLEHRSEKPPA